MREITILAVIVINVLINAADLVPVVFISVMIAVFGDKSTMFNKFDLGCLAAVVMSHRRET